MVMIMEEEAMANCGSYYTILGLSSGCSLEEIRRAYRKLAMKWHPDRWTRRNPSLLVKANRKFQQIQQAYSVLSDQRKRLSYDAGIYNPFNEDEDEGMCDFMEELVSLMGQSKREESYSLEELQKMLLEMAQGSFVYNYESKAVFEEPPAVFSKKMRLETNTLSR